MKITKHDDGRIEYDGTTDEMIALGFGAGLRFTFDPACTECAKSTGKCAMHAAQHWSPPPALTPANDPHAAPGIGCRACQESSAGCCGQHFRRWYPAVTVDSPFQGTTPLRVLLFQEEDRWVAQCVDLDICTSADTFDDAQVNFARQLLIEANECQRAGKSLSSLPKPPDGYTKAWESIDPDTAGLRLITIESLIEKIKEKSASASSACDIKDDDEEEPVKIPSYVPHPSVLAALGLDGLDRRIRA